MRGAGNKARVYLPMQIKKHSYVMYICQASLVPRPRNSDLVHTIRTCARIKGNGHAVNVSINKLSHMAMSSTEAAYMY